MLETNHLILGIVNKVTTFSLHVQVALLLQYHGNYRFPTDR